MATKTAKKASTNGAAADTGADAAASVITIPRLNIGELMLSVVGDTALISNKWSEKAVKMMVAKQTKQAKPGREAKDPKADYEATIYRLPDGSPAFPSVAFKAAAVAACRFVKGDIKMTEARGAFHVEGMESSDLVRIEGEPKMREDMVRLATGVADVRYRAEFMPWSAALKIRYNEAALSPAQIINLFNIAGFGVGVGEWRPSNNGQFGMFHVVTQGEIDG